MLTGREIHKRSGFASPDYLEQTMVLSSGGFRMSPGEEMEVSNRNRKPVLFPNKVKTNAIESHIKPELLEKLEELRRGKF